MAGNVIYANTRQLDQIAKLLEGYPKDAVRIMNNVLSRTADTVRVEAGRQIPKVFGAPQKEIKSALNSKQRKVKTVMGASGTGSVSVVVLGRPLTITRFQHVPTSPVKKNKGGKKRNVQPMVKIYSEKGRLPLGPVRGTDGKNNKVFLAPVKNGTEERYLFAVRNGPKKYRVLRSLSVPQMVTNEGVGTVIVDKVNEAIMKRLTHELDRTFGNLGTNLAKGAG
ncbi:hypothetical protein [Clostridium sp. KNHs216]|uniref:hypothetical protein n=1 Tax=Clostridium sp. KNHs216 TaxID=1550235 RepID=UPI001150270D|nr:hypothetical protein [Clostridium sp. KNHs216]TQI66736.1 hypothetical protein LY85_1407 [Clostridium sp. KNHs216]